MSQHSLIIDIHILACCVYHEAKGRTPTAQCSSSSSTAPPTGSLPKPTCLHPRSVATVRSFLMSQSSELLDSVALESELLSEFAASCVFSFLWSSPCDCIIATIHYNCAPWPFRLKRYVFALPSLVPPLRQGSTGKAR